MGGGEAAIVANPVGAIGNLGLAKGASLLTGSMGPSFSGAQGAAQAQLRQAQQNVGLFQEDIQGSRDIVTQESRGERAALRRALQTQETALNRQQALLNNLDPSLKEAANQALALISGESRGTSAALESVRNRRQRARNRLLDRLRETLGPGAETSSAGQQALTRFDTETEDLLGNRQLQAQQAAVGNLATLQGLGQTGAQGISGIGAQQGAIGQAFGQRGQRFAGLESVGLQGTANLRGAVTGQAGAPFVGESLRQQYQGQLMNTLIGGGIQGITAGLTGGT